MPYKGESGYLQLLNDVLLHGEQRRDRTGTGTISLFAPDPLSFDLAEGVPLYTTKKVPSQTVIKELLWFVKGHTDARLLQAQGVHIWDGHTSGEFLRSRNLPYREGILGPGYGWQWRSFGAVYDERMAGQDHHNDVWDDPTDYGVDQIKYVERMLKTDPTSRRIFMSSWNAKDLSAMALIPCHVSCQFHVGRADTDAKDLSCHVYMRSNDLFLGNPFNVFSYAVLTHLLAKRCNMTAKSLTMSFGDAHVYLDHRNVVEQQLTRQPYPPPQLRVSDRVIDLPFNQILPSDFVVDSYQHHPMLRGVMSV